MKNLLLLSCILLGYNQVTAQYVNYCPYGSSGQEVSSSPVYDPSGGSNSNVPSPCGCGSSSSSSDDDDDEDVGSTSSCVCQGSDQTCNCVLGCGCTLNGDNVCADVDLINKTFSSVLTGGPYKILAIWGGQQSEQTDNICYSYFPLANSNQALCYVSRVFIDGSNTVEAFIVSDGGPGVVLNGGPTSTLRDKSYGEVPGCTANTVYVCYTWGDNVSPSSRDYQYSTYAIGPVSATRDPSCGRRAAQAMIDAGYDQRFRVLPENLPYQCVTTPTPTPTPTPKPNCY